MGIEKAIAKINSIRDRNIDTRDTDLTIPSHDLARGRLTVLPDEYIDHQSMEDSRHNLHNRPGQRRRPMPQPSARQRSFSIPHNALAEQGMIVPDAPRNLLSEEYRAIKRRILTAIDIQGLSGENGSNTIMVTSCVSGEGKTFSALNLAISIAMERDREVLFVDADITNPVAGTRLGFNTNQAGLTDLLKDNRLKVDNMVWQSSIPGLKFLPAGTVQKNVTELLSSRNMVQLTRSLSQQNPDRVVVVDTAPILLTSESSVVADLAGQIVFVVAAETTTKAMVSDALKILNDHSRIGFLLNKTRKKQSSGYGYGYGYGYGQR